MDNQQKQEIKTIFKDISNLEDNWNQYGATPFNSTFVSHIQDIVLSFKNKPDDITPTGRESIQIEYGYKEDLYLELNFYQNNDLVIFLNYLDAAKNPHYVYLKKGGQITPKDYIITNGISDIIKELNNYDLRSSKC